METILVWLIRLYQRTLSPDHGVFRMLYPAGYCRFHPTCSEYAAEAITEHGALRGLFLALARISRCHPATNPGLDPVPHRVSSN